MQFTKFTLLSLAAVASAQNIGDLLAELPADLQTYAEGLLTNTAALGALEGLIANTAVQNALNGVETAGANPTAFVQNLESAVAAAESGQPSGQQALVTSVVGVITSLGASDGLYQSVDAIAGAAGDGGSSAVASAVSGASTALSAAANSATATGPRATSTGAAGSSGASAAGNSASPSRASNTSVSQGLGASPAGMAMGAIVGAVAGLAAYL